MDKIDPELLRKYASGKCSEEESKLVEHWLEQEDNLFEQDTEQEENRQQEYVQDMWNAFIEKTEAGLQWMRIKWWGLRLGAASMIVLFIALFTHFYANSFKHDELELLTLEVAKGESANLLLSDSSEVWLSGGSKLIYPKKFGKNARELTLVKGQAYFDVKKQVNRPFIVNTDSVAIEVLGTTFNVENFVESGELSVALKTGSVAFKVHQGNSKILVPGEKLSYHKTIKSFSIDQVENTEIGEWKSGVLRFDNTPIADALHKIEAQYGVIFDVKDKKILNTPITGKFNKLPLKNVVLLLEQSTSLQFVQQADTIQVIK